MMNRLFYIFCCLLGCGGFTTQAQHNPMHPHRCGITLEDEFLVRERMFANRMNKTAIMANRHFRSGDSTIYIPIQFHLIANTNGRGRATVEQMFQALCKINADYADQRIRFYLKNPPHLINNDMLYVNTNVNLTNPMMSLFKVLGAVNIFIVRRISSRNGGGIAGYYTPRHDHICVISSNLNSTSRTLTHELGHFFTLAHPFFGWERVDPRDTTVFVNGVAPVSINGVTVENVARGTADENCQWAADGFCDTKPDYNFGYYEYLCGLTIGTFYDPLGVELEVPNSDNYMSYYRDACTDDFTNEQKQAILTDVIRRGYDRLNIPKVEITSSPTIIWPTATEPAPYFGGFDLQWTAATGATHYYVQVKRYINGAPIETVIDRIVTGTSVWVPLEPNRNYGWTVKPINGYDTDCDNDFTTPINYFKTGDWSVDVDATAATIESSRIYPNPADKTTEIMLEINSRTNTDAQISIYNSLGQVRMADQEIRLTAGANIQWIDVSMLSAGMYILNIKTVDGRISHKLMLNN